MSPAKQSFEKLLRQLHRTQLDGLGEPPFADELRDEMDVYWYQLTDEEQGEMRRLSARLYEEEPHAWMSQVSRGDSSH